MSTVKNLVGQRFNSLIVIEMVDYIKGNGPKWRVRCDCGNETIVKSCNLRSGNTRSCGCRRIEVMRATGKRNHKDFRKCIIKILHTNYRVGSKRRGLTFDLSLDHFSELIFKNCEYCGIEPSLIRQHPTFAGEIVYNGVDRVDNKKGYVVDNCVPCCKICNLGKHSMSYDKWINYLDQVVKHRGSLNVN